MSDGETGQGGSGFRYERGIPILDVQSRLTEVERKAAETEARDEQYKRRQEAINFRLMLFTGFLVATSVISGGIAIWQATIAHRSAKAAESAAITASDTLKEIQKSSLDTHELAVQAKNQADRTKDIADRALAQSDATNRLAAEAKKQADAANKSLSIAQEQFRQEQRPLIRINRFEYHDWSGGQKINVPETGKPVTVNIYFLNVGKSNALNEVTHDHLLFKSQMDQFRIEPEDSPDRVGDTLAPGTTDDEGIMVTAVSLKNPYVREGVGVNLGQVLDWDGTDIIVVGRVTYEDEYGVKYCQPYMVQGLPQGGWANIGSFDFIPPGGETKHHPLGDLCPPNTRR